MQKFASITFKSTVPLAIAMTLLVLSVIASDRTITCTVPFCGLYFLSFVNIYLFALLPIVYVSGLLYLTIASRKLRIPRYKPILFSGALSHIIVVLSAWVLLSDLEGIVSLILLYLFLLALPLAFIGWYIFYNRN